MPLNITLLTPRRQFIANKYGLGYQIPLGLVLIGGPLVDAGHQVRLLDNDALGWDDPKLARELLKNPPDYLMIGHTGSTAAHPVAMETARFLKQHLPETIFVYGGVYPSYTAKAILADNPAIDIIVQGEGEETVLELTAAQSPAQVKGITWRDGVRIRANPSRSPIANLDNYRPGWELLDWDNYRLFGFGRSAGMQFSRGCTLRCTYCGQWSFWRRWRHRSPQNFADEVERLVRDYGVRIVWLADENFAADREAARQALECVVERKLNISLNLNMTAADVVRDADLLHLYKQAGVDNIVMGVEALDDDTVANVHKNNPFAVSKQAVQLLRKHGIVSLVNIIYGLEEERLSTLTHTLRRLFDLDADVVNAVYITPHAWTKMGRQVKPDQIIQPDQARWTYRNQVVDTPRLAPWQLFLSVKLTEALFHLRPKALWRLITAPDRRYRQVLRAYLATGFRVVLAEMKAFIFDTQFTAANNPVQVSGSEVRFAKKNDSVSVH